MKDRKAIRKTISLRGAVFMSLAAAALVFLIYVGYENEDSAERLRQEAAAEEYAALLDESMQKAKDEGLLRQYGVTDISWKVTDISADHSAVRRYIMSVQVDCDGDVPEQSDIADYYYEIGSHIPGTGFAGEELEIMAETGDIMTVYNTDEESEYWGKRMIYLNVSGKALVYPEYADPLKGEDLRGMKVLKTKEEMK